MTERARSDARLTYLPVRSDAERDGHSSLSIRVPPQDVFIAALKRVSIPDDDVSDLQRSESTRLRPTINRAGVARSFGRAFGRVAARVDEANRRGADIEAILLRRCIRLSRLRWARRAAQREYRGSGQTFQPASTHDANLASRLLEPHDLEVADCDFKIVCSSSDSWNMKSAGNRRAFRRPCAFSRFTGTPYNSAKIGRNQTRLRQDHRMTGQ